jgi:pantetheine-phosphate adenylyltransferase
VLTNPKKDPLFSVDERIAMIREALGAYNERVEVDSFDGLLVDFCKKRNVRVILRGLRAVADFEYELQMANMNRHLNAEVETVFIMANDAYFYVSSNLCKEVATLGADVSKLVPPAVAPRLRAKLGR